MVTVRFYGMLRLDLAASSTLLEAGNINELLQKLDAAYEKVDLKVLKGSVIFVNGKNINELKGFKTILADGDEVLFMSPVGGG